MPLYLGRTLLLPEPFPRQESLPWMGSLAQLFPHLTTMDPFTIQCTLQQDLCSNEKPFHQSFPPSMSQSPASPLSSLIWAPYLNPCPETSDLVPSQLPFPIKPTPAGPTCYQKPFTSLCSRPQPGPLLLPGILLQPGPLFQLVNPSQSRSPTLARHPPPPNAAHSNRVPFSFLEAFTNLCPCPRSGLLCSPVCYTHFGSPPLPRGPLLPMPCLSACASFPCHVPFFLLGWTHPQLSPSFPDRHPSIYYAFLLGLVFFPQPVFSVL